MSVYGELYDTADDPDGYDIKLLLGVCQGTHEILQSKIKEHGIDENGSYYPSAEKGTISGSKYLRNTTGICFIIIIIFNVQ